MVQFDVNSRFLIGSLSKTYCLWPRAIHFRFYFEIYIWKSIFCGFRQFAIHESWMLRHAKMIHFLLSLWNSHFAKCWVREAQLPGSAEFVWSLFVIKHPDQFWGRNWKEIDLMIIILFQSNMHTITIVNALYSGYAVQAVIKIHLINKSIQRVDVWRCVDSLNLASFQGLTREIFLLKRLRTDGPQSANVCLKEGRSSFVQTVLKSEWVLAPWDN